MQVERGKERQRFVSIGEDSPSFGEKNLVFRTMRRYFLLPTPPSPVPPGDVTLTKKSMIKLG